MKIVMLDEKTLGDDLDLSVLDRFGKVVRYDATAPNEVCERIADADVIIQNKVKITKEAILSAPKLKLICETATGYDNIDIATCKERGITVCNTPSYSTYCVQQVTLSMACELTTHLSAFRETVADGTYSKSKKANCLTPVYHEFYGKTWGVIGYGNIGKSVADVARALGCRVLIYRLHADSHCVDLDTLLRESDIVSLHTPLNDGTRNLLSKEKIALLKSNAIVINVARGGVWDEGAIAEAVLRGAIGGIGCDVYQSEPFDVSHPFNAIKGLANVCLTPHMAWGGYETRLRCLQMTADNIERFIKGTPIHTV